MAKRKAKDGKRRGRANPAPAVTSLIVQFKHTEDPSSDQTEQAVRIVEEFSAKAQVTGWFSGVLRVEVEEEAIETFRDKFADLDDWEVAVEGRAQMPPRPIPEEPEDG